MNRKTLTIICASAVAASVAVAGLEYKCVVTSEGQTKGSSSKATTKMWVDQDKLRAETVEGTGFGGEKGGYMLTTNAGQTMIMVDPSQKTYMAWDMGRMMGAMNMIQMKVSNNKFEKLLEEDGGTVMGYPTRHYRFRTSYDMEVSVFGMKQTSSCTQDEDLWSTTKLKHAAMDAWGKTSMKMISNNPELAKLVDMRMQKMEGVPLKMVTVSTTKAGTDATPTTSKSVMEFVEIKETAIPASVFEIPKDYKETVIPNFEDHPDLRKARKARQQAEEADDVDVKAEAKKAAKEAAQEVAEEKVDAVMPAEPSLAATNAVKAVIRDSVKNAIKGKLKLW